MTTINLAYEGALHCRLTHPSGAEIQTDAPKDNQGKGEAFSPTDLVAAALLSCAVTTMAIKGGLKAASGSVVKEMQPSPRRIAKLSIELRLPDSLHAEERAKLQDIALNCPVALSLAKEVEVDMRFLFAPLV